MLLPGSGIYIQVYSSICGPNHAWSKTNMEDFNCISKRDGKGNIAIQKDYICHATINICLLACSSPQMPKR